MSPRHRSPLRIGVVTQYYLPENVQIPVSLADELARRGHEVRVVTGYPNYPTGRLFPGYRQRFGRTERHGDVAVFRTPIWISHSRNPLGRIASYISFGLSSLSASRFLRDVDVVYVYATQMTASLAPMLWWKFRGVPFVLHVLDLWPESVNGSGMLGVGPGRFLSGLMGPWLRVTYKSAAATIGPTPTITATLISRGACADSTHTVYNWSTHERPADPSRERPTRATRLMYAGNIGEMQDLETVMRAMHLSTDIEGLSLDVFGDGTARADIEKLADDLRLTSVRFHGQVSAERVAEYGKSVDFQLVTLKDIPLFRMTIPSKFQASLAVGVPVITTVGGDLAALVRDRRVGLVAAPGDPTALSVAFRQAASMQEASRLRMRRAAQTLYDTEMSREAAIMTIERILTRAADTARPRALNSNT
jgi:colanic acid biosynthesis glycosyl transferase WcaI